MRSNNGFSEYKKVRDYLRKYNKHNLLESLVQYSGDLSLKYENQDKNLHNSMLLRPHYAFLLGRWIIRDWENINGHKIVNQGEDTFNEMLRRIVAFEKVDSQIRLKHNNTSANAIMRGLALQQNWYQERSLYDDLGRHVELFINTSISSDFERDIIEHIGLNIGDFFRSALFICLHCLHNNVAHFREDEVHLGNHFHQNKMHSFLSSISLCEDTFNTFDQKQEIKFFQENFEKSPFFGKPFLKFGETYYCWSIYLLDQMIQFGVYDILKGDSRFKNKWGGIFENYIQSRLNHYSVNYINEKKIRKFSNNQVDFLITHNSDLILIEAKSIEAAKHTRAFPTPEVMQQSYKNNIIKAFYQANSVAEALNLDRNQPFKRIFLFVVTYKELFLGSGESAWDEFIKKKFKEKYPENHFNLNPKDIFFMTIRDLDTLLSYMEGSVEEIIKFLKQIVVSKSDTKNQRFYFSQYLKELPMKRRKEDQYLTKAFEHYWHTSNKRSY